LTAGQIVQFIGKEGPSTKVVPEKKVQKQFLRRDDVEIAVAASDQMQLVQSQLPRLLIRALANQRCWICFPLQHWAMRGAGFF